jgi:geranylgeranyl pyrophosphate synthase
MKKRQNREAVTNRRRSDLTARQLKDYIADTNKAVRRCIASALKKLPYSFLRPLLRDCTSLKAIYDRALVARLSCETVGGDWTNCLPAFAALELVDCAVIAADDILDEGIRRLGKPSLHMKWGLKRALVGIEVAKSLGMVLLEESPGGKLIRTVYERMYQEIYAGQYLDLVYESADISIVTPDDALRIVRLTTGSQVAACCEIGALLGDSDRFKAKNLYFFGLYAGTLLQIRDDVIDYLDDEKAIGKIPFSDFRLSKKKLPLVLAWNMANEKEREEIAQFLQQASELTKEQKRRIIELITRDKVVTAIEGYMRNLKNKAERYLYKLPQNQSRQLLHYILELGTDLR